MGFAPPSRRGFGCRSFSGWGLWSTFMVEVVNLGFTVCGSRREIYGVCSTFARGFWVSSFQGLGFVTMVHDSELRVQDLGFRIYGRWVSV